LIIVKQKVKMKSLSRAFRSRPVAFRWFPGLLLGVALAGCGRNNIEVYRVAKETASGQPPAAASSEAAADPAGSPQLHWKLPPGWKEVPPGEMRVASFSVAGKNGQQADVSVVPLPGLAGGDLDNVNRWRGQVGQAAITAEEMAKTAEPVEMAGQTAKLYDQAGTNPGSGDKARILAAILRREGVAWFFKMSGDDALVAEQKSAFIEFLKSIEFAAPSAQTGLPPSHPPIAGMNMPNSVPSSSDQAKPAWQVPTGWQEVPGGQFLVAKFQLAGENNAQAAVNVSMSAGDGGGALANVNRWRTQLGLPAFGEADLTKAAKSLDVSGSKAMFVDMTGTDARTQQKARLLAAIVPHAQQTWFYKLMGNEQIVDREAAAFTKFVQTAKYPDAQ
jgi:hypothetical protein